MFHINQFVLLLLKSSFMYKIAKYHVVPLGLHIEFDQDHYHQRLIKSCLCHLLHSLQWQQLVEPSLKLESQVLLDKFLKVFLIILFRKSIRLPVKSITNLLLNSIYQITWRAFRNHVWIGSCVHFGRWVINILNVCAVLR